jgi:hypothetical protein
MSNDPIRWGSVLLAALLASCGEPDVPQVLCNHAGVASSQKKTAPTPTGACTFSPTYDFVVAHALEPEGVTTTDSDGGTSTTTSASAAVYGNLKVSITRASAAFTLCPGMSCVPEQAEIQVKTDARGLLRYTIRVDANTVGLPNAGEATVINGAVLETYGPGNTCTVPVSLVLNCEAPL